jgi:hypothetical protein
VFGLRPVVRDVEQDGVEDLAEGVEVSVRGLATDRAEALQRLGEDGDDVLGRHGWPYREQS